MLEYSKLNVKLTNTQLKKLKTDVKMKTKTTLRKSLKIFDVNDLPHELLLTARQKTKLRNAFNNNMSTDIKLSNSICRILKIIIEQISRSINESSSSIGKKCFSSITNYSCCFSNWCRDPKENTWFWNNYFNNLKWGNEWHGYGNEMAF